MQKEVLKFQDIFVFGYFGEADGFANCSDGGAFGCQAVTRKRSPTWSPKRAPSPQCRWPSPLRASPAAALSRSKWERGARRAAQLPLHELYTAPCLGGMGPSFGWVGQPRPPGLISWQHVGRRTRTHLGAIEFSETPSAELTNAIASKRSPLSFAR